MTKNLRKWIPALIGGSAVLFAALAAEIEHNRPEEPRNGAEYLHGSMAFSRDIELVWKRLAGKDLPAALLQAQVAESRIAALLGTEHEAYKDMVALRQVLQHAVVVNQDIMHVVNYSNGPYVEPVGIKALEERLFPEMESYLKEIAGFDEESRARIENIWYDGLKMIQTALMTGSKIQEPRTQQIYITLLLRFNHLVRQTTLHL